MTGSFYWKYIFRKIRRKGKRRRRIWVTRRTTTRREMEEKKKVLREVVFSGVIGIRVHLLSKPNKTITWQERTVSNATVDNLWVVALVVYNNSYTVSRREVGGNCTEEKKQNKGSMKIEGLCRIQSSFLYGLLNRKSLCAGRCTVTVSQSPCMFTSLTPGVGLGKSVLALHCLLPGTRTYENNNSASGGGTIRWDGVRAEDAGRCKLSPVWS